MSGGTLNVGGHSEASRHSQPSARARADIEKAAALVESRDDRIHRARDVRNLRAYRGRYLLILAVDHPEHVLRVELVDLSRRRITLLGQEQTERVVYQCSVSTYVPVVASINTE